MYLVLSLKKNSGYTLAYATVYNATFTHFLHGHFNVTCGEIYITATIHSLILDIYTSINLYFNKYYDNVNIDSSLTLKHFIVFIKQY